MDAFSAFLISTAKAVFWRCLGVIGERINPSVPVVAQLAAPRPRSHSWRLPHLCKGRRPIPSSCARLHRAGCRTRCRNCRRRPTHGMGNRSVGLGHAYAAVVDAAQRELANGCNFTRPSAIEVACAEQFLRMIDGAEMVKFCKNGSDATSGAMRLARACTGRDLIALTMVFRTYQESRKLTRHRGNAGVHRRRADEPIISRKKRWLAQHSLFLQETIARGILMPSLVVSYSHGDEDIDRTVEAIDGALGVYKTSARGWRGEIPLGPPVANCLSEIQSARRCCGRMIAAATVARLSSGQNRGLIDKWAVP